MTLAPRHLLVRLPGPLGDAVLATPALRALRRALPDARLTWAGGPAALAAVEGLGDRDDVIPVAGRFARGLRAPWRSGRLWRRARPDGVLLLPHSFSSALAARFCGAGTRVGAPLHGRGFLLTHRVALPREGRRLAPRPMTAMYLDLVRPFGATDDGERPRVVVSAFHERRASARLAALELPDRWIAVSPGAGFGPSKVCPPEVVGAAIRATHRESGLRALVLCAPGEEDLAERTAAAAGESALSTHADPPDVGELKALLARAAVLLTTDAGPRHLAEALGIPTVVWMGPTDPRWTEGGTAVVLRNETLTCLGCHHPVCPIAHPCLADLDPARIAAAALAALSPAPGPAEPGRGPTPG